MMDTLLVEGFGYVAPYATLEDFPLGPEIELDKPDLTLLDRSLRRGLSDVTRYFFHAAQRALTQAAVTARDVHVVFASAFGEIATAEALMAQAFDENTASPARFRHSVHNTAAGLLSISAQNTRPSTAISGGWETVAMALLEASAQLADGADRVLLVLAEERVPLALSADHAYAPLGAAFVLSRMPRARYAGRLRGLRRAHLSAADDPFAGKSHPLGPALSLCRALERNALSTLVVGEGEPPWVVDVDGRATP